MEIHLFHDRKYCKYYISRTRFFCSRSLNEWFSWRRSHLRQREEEEEAELCHRVMVQAHSTQRERNHHSEGAGEMAVWSEVEGEKEILPQNTAGKRQGAKLSRSRFENLTRLTILFWQFLPIGDRWVITKTKQYGSTRLTLKCSGLSY